MRNLEVPMFPVNLKLVTATGEVAPFHGKINANFSIGKIVRNIDILIYFSAISGNMPSLPWAWADHGHGMDLSKKLM